jgi:hypothetical protein
LWARRRKIQLFYINRFETIWEYKKSFLAGEINFPASIGSVCPICGDLECYRQITPYWRYAVELFPEFEKKCIPIARFLCRKRKVTFSVLPIQLIPYRQYTASAVVGTVLLGLGCWLKGQRGFFGASVEVHPDCLVTPWLVACWLAVIIGGFRRAHAMLGRFYDLSRMSASQRSISWQEAHMYFLAFGLKPNMVYRPLLLDLLCRYSYATKQFLFGTPSQMRFPLRQ